MFALILLKGLESSKTTVFQRKTCHGLPDKLNDMKSTVLTGPYEQRENKTFDTEYFTVYFFHMLKDNYTKMLSVAIFLCIICYFRCAFEPVCFAYVYKELEKKCFTIIVGNSAGGSRTFVADVNTAIYFQSNQPGR